MKSEMGYRSFNQAMKDRFGTKVYKLALDGGMTCPNRDGTIGRRGCIFCSDVGSGEFAVPQCGDTSAQIARAKNKVVKKNPNGKYIAYFQSFTNTYAPVDYLERIFRQAIDPEEIAGLSIATRPDCLSKEVLDLLAQINLEKPVWVELGLQTIHPKSANYIRRGYDLPVYDRAVSALKARHLEVITHVILGLPGESREDMVATAHYVGHSGADGIKLQLLHILEGTDLAQEYRVGQLSPLTLEEYICILEDCLAVLPPEMIIHRLTGDGAKGELLAPLWSADKKRVLNAIRTAFARDHVRQGSQWRPKQNRTCNYIEQEKEELSND